MDLIRDVSAGVMGAISGPSFYPVVMVWLDWPDGAVRAHSGTGTIHWDGHIWQGVGRFGSIDAPEESLSGVPIEFSLSLVCDLPELAAYADSQIRQRPGAIWLGATTTAGGGNLLGDPTELCFGTMDTLVLSTQADDGGINYRLSVGCATGPGYRSMAAINHSHEDQSRKYPGDTAGARLMQLLAKAAVTLWPAP